MSDRATLRVTPAELAGVAAQVRVLSRTCIAGVVQLRNALGAVGPPDPAADEVLRAGARAAHAALGEVSDTVASLVAELGRGLDGQAAALARAAHGYEYAERQVSAAVDQVGRRHG